ncbi:expressed unknown protein [Seminavis robusta]|uniref:Uncharacterized protein n=1 Tax=Seminavis robusta TaxID=568900 RepID=A0A9N8DPJ1_9STRA|nr:expressed unknown protein [Seminavis robusta]|eukprot:Sro265_g102860.1 n/a (153) ;mRNA; r:55859-56317
MSNINSSNRFPLEGLDLIISSSKKTTASPATEALHEQLTVAKRRKLNSNGDSALSMTQLHSSLPSSFVYHNSDHISFLQQDAPFPTIDFDSSFGLNDDEDHSDLSDSSIKSLLGSSSLSSCGRRKTCLASSSHGMVRSRTILSSICRLDAAQ